jgi:chitin disaccharide deacetylase
MLIVNADDWGMCPAATDAALECHRQGRISSASAMVFMEDSERGAKLAVDCGMDVGLHINFTSRFTGDTGADRLLVEHQERLRRFLCFSRYALVLYNPFLRESFRHVYRRQHDEFCRLYGKPPSHIDGHQHMHLCSNMLIDRILPGGVPVRRSFTFGPGEKSWLNRAYRRRVDALLARRNRVTDYFFALSQNKDPGRLARVMSLAREANVELMTHPAVPEEQAILQGDDYGLALRGVTLGTHARL